MYQCSSICRYSREAVWVELAHKGIHDAVEGCWVGLSQAAQQLLVCGNEQQQAQGSSTGRG
jgi:hypothetical protein